MKQPPDTAKNKPIARPATYAAISSSIVELLNAARLAAARNVNALMTASYWEIGRRIVEAEQKGKRRAGYGEQLIERLSVDLTQQFGRGFFARNLEQMRQFYLIWPIPQTVSAESQKLELTNGGGNPQTASAQSGWAELANAFPLPWSAYVRLLAVKDEHARQFYERSALSKNKAAMLTKGDLQQRAAVQAQMMAAIIDGLAESRPDSFSNDEITARAAMVYQYGEQAVRGTWH